MWISSDDGTNCIDESDSKYYTQNDRNVDMHMANDEDGPYSAHCAPDVDIESHGDDEKDDGEKDDDNKEHEEEDDEDEKEDEDEEDGKEPQTIGQREMVNT
jgi:hypothetical protein